MKALQKETISFAIATFIVWAIVEVVIDLLTGVPISEMMTVNHIIVYIAGAFGFAILFTIFEILRNKRKK